MTSPCILSILEDPRPLSFKLSVLDKSLQLGETLLCGIGHALAQLIYGEHYLASVLTEE